MSKPLFQKRHYEVIAECFRGRCHAEGKDAAVHTVIEAFKRDNPKFNEDKFWRAIQSEK